MTLATRVFPVVFVSALFALNENLTETNDEANIEFEPVHPKIDWDNISEEDFKNYVRFGKHEFNRLLAALDMPNQIILQQRTKFSNKEGLLILLARFCYPNRLLVLRSMFGRSETALSLIFNWMTNYIWENFGWLLEFYWNNLTEEIMEEFATAICRTSGYGGRCIGFIDGTFRPTCRPTVNQRHSYSGHKREHGIKFQSIAFPNGLIGHLSGPIWANSMMQVF